MLENSGHGIMLDAPKDVVEGVRTIWNEAHVALHK